MKQAKQSDERPEGHPSNQATEETAPLVAEAAPGHSGLTGIYQQRSRSRYYFYTEQSQSEATDALAAQPSLAEIPSCNVFPSGNVTRSSRLEAIVDAENQERPMTAETPQWRPPVLTAQGGAKALDTYDDTQYATAVTTITGMTSEGTRAANLLHESYVDVRKPDTPKVRHQREFTVPHGAQPYPQEARQRPNTGVCFTATARNIPAMILSDRCPTPPLVPQSVDVFCDVQDSQFVQPQSSYPLPPTTTHQYEMAPPQRTWSVVEVDENENVHLRPLPNRVRNNDLSLPGTIQDRQVPNHASLWFTGQVNQLGHPQGFHFIRPPAVPPYDPVDTQRTPSVIQQPPQQLNSALRFTPVVYNNNPVMTAVGRHPAVPPEPSGQWHAPQGNQLGLPPIPVHNTPPPSITMAQRSPGVSLQPVPQPAIVSQKAGQQHAGYGTPHFQMAPPCVSESDPRTGQCATGLPFAQSMGKEKLQQVMARLQEYGYRSLRIRENMLENTRSLLRQLKDGEGMHSQAHTTAPHSTQSTTEHIVSQVMAVIDDYGSREKRLSEGVFECMLSFAKSLGGSDEASPQAMSKLNSGSSSSRLRAARYRNREYIADVQQRFAHEEQLREPGAATVSTATTSDHHRSDNPGMTRECDALASAMARLQLQPVQEHLHNPEERTSGPMRPVDTGSAPGATPGRRRLQEFQRLCPLNPEVKQDDTVVSQPAVSAERPQRHRRRRRARASQH